MSNGKILIVEDEKDLRDIYAIILQHEGFDVKEAVNGKDALDIIESYHPDLVLLDITMPVLDGKGFLEKYDAKQHPRTKIVVCSNTSDDELIMSMVKLGADKVVTKADLGPEDLSNLAKSYLQPV